MQNVEVELALIRLDRAKGKEILAWYQLGLAIFHAEELIKALKEGQRGNSN